MILVIEHPDSSLGKKVMYLISSNTLYMYTYVYNMYTYYDITGYNFVLDFCMI